MKNEKTFRQMGEIARAQRFFRKRTVDFTPLVIQFSVLNCRSRGLRGQRETIYQIEEKTGGSL
jgi:hypothetical protein